MKIHTVHPTTPSGLRRAYQPYRKKPYVARWYESGRMRNRFFASAAAREEFVSQFKTTKDRQDPVLPALAPHQLMRWQQAVAIAPDADPRLAST